LAPGLFRARHQHFRQKRARTVHPLADVLAERAVPQSADLGAADVREWVSDLKAAGASPTGIRQCHTILSAVFTTAFNDQITRLHQRHRRLMTECSSSPGCGGPN
jgi:hypothetical protein